MPPSKFYAMFLMWLVCNAKWHPWRGRRRYSFSIWIDNFVISSFHVWSNLSMSLTKYRQIARQHIHGISATRQLSTESIFSQADLDSLKSRYLSSLLEDLNIKEGRFNVETSKVEVSGHPTHSQLPSGWLWEIRCMRTSFSWMHSYRSETRLRVRALFPKPS